MRLRVLVLTILSGLLFQGCASDEGHRRHREESETAEAHGVSEADFDKAAAGLRKRIQDARRKMDRSF